MLPLLLTGNANVWFSASTWSGKSYKQLCNALKKQFHMESDIWLLRQQLLNRKQLPNEMVAPFAFEIRKLCQSLDLSTEENMNSLFNGLKPQLKNYVILQWLKTFLEAETHAKLHEALLDDKPKDRTDEILSALAKLKGMEEPKIAVYYTPFTNSNTLRGGGGGGETRQFSSGDGSINGDPSKINIGEVAELNTIGIFKEVNVQKAHREIGDNTVSAKKNHEETKSIGNKLVIRYNNAVQKELIQERK